MIGEKVFGIANDGNQVAGQGHDGAEEAGEDKDEGHACAGTCADERAEGVCQRAAAHHGGFEHDVGEGTGDETGERGSDPGDEAAHGEDAALHVGRYFGLPDSLVGAVDDGHKERGEEDGDRPDDGARPRPSSV